MRFGRYAVYKGNEFEIWNLMDGSITLISKHGAHEGLGFERDDVGNIVKRVKIEELSSLI